MGAEQRLAELGIELPPAPSPAGSYLPARRSGDHVYVSGQLPMEDGSPIVGKVGADLSLEQGRHAARMAGLNALAVLRAELGSLDAVAGIVRLLGMVNAAPGFTELPAVINGCSDLMFEVFGDSGCHARAAVGVAELPLGAAVEIELVAELIG
jgi:enamine deaminase RidA (YjgF/YER057c/UK114 family)